MVSQSKKQPASAAQGLTMSFHLRTACFMAFFSALILFHSCTHDLVTNDAPDTHALAVQPWRHFLILPAGN